MKKEQIGATYRAKIACRIARDSMDGKNEVPNAINPMEYAIYNLLHAIEDIAIALEEIKDQNADIKNLLKNEKWIYEDQLPDDYPYDEMFPLSKIIDGVRMFPQIKKEG